MPGAWPTRWRPGGTGVWWVVSTAFDSAVSSWGRMFSSPQRGGTDSSKVCLVWLVHHLKRIGVEILDVQFSTDHLARLGAIEIPRRRYLADLARCRHHRTRWQGWPEELIVRATPGSGPS